MNIIIVGAGAIGLHMARTLSDQEHSICLIEQDEKLAEQLNEELDNFVYSVSHDLRSPLLSVKGILSLILTTEKIHQIR